LTAYRRPRATSKARKLGFAPALVVPSDVITPVATSTA
jgi:hypothetical protein